MSASAIAPLDKKSAESALVEACRGSGFGTPEFALIRLGENAVFRITDPPMVARVGRDVGRHSEFAREVQISRWLNSRGVPTIEAIRVEQPIDSQGRVVSFWEVADGSPEFGTIVEFANLLKRLHSLAPPPDIDLPTFEPMRRVAERIDEAAALDSAQKDFLRMRHAELAAKYKSLKFALPSGVIHGDANVGNTLRSADGDAVFSDLDGFSIGPREWDLILTAMYFDRYGWHSQEEYVEFVDAYGFDITDWSGYNDLADIREFSMVTWLAQNASDDSDVRGELQKRLDALRLGSSRHDWSPF